MTNKGGRGRYEGKVTNKGGRGRYEGKVMNKGGRGRYEGKVVFSEDLFSSLTCDNYIHFFLQVCCCSEENAPTLNKKNNNCKIIQSFCLFEFISVLFLEYGQS